MNKINLCFRVKAITKDKKSDVSLFGNTVSNSA